MGRRQSQILASESEKIEKINKAQGTEFNYSTTWPPYLFDRSMECASSVFSIVNLQFRRLVRHVYAAGTLLPFWFLLQVMPRRFWLQLKPKLKLYALLLKLFQSRYYEPSWCCSNISPKLIFRVGIVSVSPCLELNTGDQRSHYHLPQNYLSQGILSQLKIRH